MKAEVLCHSDCILGESPSWHAYRNSCFWTDVEQKIVFEYSWDSKNINQYKFAERVSLIVSGSEDELILGLQGGVAKFSPVSAKLSWITRLEENWQTHRCNDGGCDNKGRLWISSMELDHKSESAAIYRVDINGVSKKIIDKITIPNGIVWSPDNKRMYYTDSLTREILSYLYTDVTGDIVFEKAVVRIPESAGVPDGMAMDEEGMLWVALWDGFGVGRFDLNSGKMVGFIEIPAQQVTCCCFAGPDLDHLVITTAKRDMTTEHLNAYPESGSVFIIKPGVKGLKNFHSGL